MRDAWSELWDLEEADFEVAERREEQEDARALSTEGERAHHVLVKAAANMSRIWIESAR
jgi:hypothetical protein